MTTILLVEDDTRLATLIAEYLQRDGYTVQIEPDGIEAARRIPVEQPDLVILDIMLPGMDGFEVCKVVRPHFFAPILMMTARSEEVDEILGLEIGADDFLTIPVRPRILLSRVKALLRRTRSTEPSTEKSVMQFGELCVDFPIGGLEWADV